MNRRATSLQALQKYPPKLPRRSLASGEAKGQTRRLVRDFLALLL
jgi:hypothetical protein